MKKVNINSISFYTFIIFFSLINIQNIEAQSLTIIHTNDIHSQVKPVKSKNGELLGGVERRFSFIEFERKKEPDLLLVDAGDFFQGSPYFNFYKGKVDIKFMNMMGYDFVTLGNHEFDYGVKNLIKQLAKAKFTVVCANYTFKDTKLQKLIKPYSIVYRNNKKIGIFGLTTDIRNIVSEAVIKDFEYHDAIASAKAVVEILKREGCDIIICLSHLGLELMHLGGQEVCDEMIASQIPEIDIIIGGHTHTLLTKPVIIGETAIVQSGSKGENIGKLYIKFNH